LGNRPTNNNLTNQDKDDRQDSTLVDQVIMDEQTSIDIRQWPKDKEPPSRNKQMKSSAGVTATTGVELSIIQQPEVCW
jgi:hypothetical protein